MKTSSKEANLLLSKLIHEYCPDMGIRIVEIGARPVQDNEEPYQPILDVFGNAEIIAFEVDETLCQELNQSSHPNHHYYPHALGRKSGKQQFYETQNPMCSSLYEPDAELLEKYNLMEEALPKATHEIEVITLDQFSETHDIGSVDMVKIDIQGAELDVFEGGKTTIENALFVVSEVEFIPLYKKQPLFGDVCGCLAQQGLMFHKFIDLSGRALKPIALQNNPLMASQLMWADAVFVSELKALPSLANESLYKTALFAFMYGSPDLTYYCFTLLDERNNSDLRMRFAQLGRN